MWAAACFRHQGKRWIILTNFPSRPRSEVSPASSSHLPSLLPASSPLLTAARTASCFHLASGPTCLAGPLTGNVEEHQRFKSRIRPMALEDAQALSEEPTRWWKWRSSGPSSCSPAERGAPPAAGLAHGAAVEPGTEPGLGLRRKPHWPPSACARPRRGEGWGRDGGGTAHGAGQVGKMHLRDWNGWWAHGGVYN